MGEAVSGNSTWRMMPTIFALGLIFAPMVHSQDSGPDTPGKPIPGPVPLNSPQGLAWLDRSAAKASFVPLSMYFETQDDLAYCGAATCTMLLNASNIPRPVSTEHRPYKLFTQSNLFTVAVREVIGPDAVSRTGMTLRTLGEVLKAYPVAPKVTFAADITIDRFRQDAIHALSNPGEFVAINYLRSVIGQDTGGHISPLAAFNEAEDRFLILDVARYKYPPVWVKTEALFQAMLSVDEASNKSRGYIIIKAPDEKPR